MLGAGQPLDRALTILLELPEDAGKAWVLHPLQAAAGAADARAKQARYGAPEGTFIVPGRTAVVFVIEKGE